MLRGKIKSVDRSRGIGTIVSNGREIQFDFSCVEDDEFDRIHVGQRVVYELEEVVGEHRFDDDRRPRRSEPLQANFVQLD